MIRSNVVATLSLAFVIAGCTSSARTQTSPNAVRVNADAFVIQQFTKRVAEYEALQGQLDESAPELRDSGDTAAAIQTHQKGLAAKIRAARGNAQEGEVFEKAVRAWFRRAIARELGKPGGRAAQASVDESNPGHAIRHKVNEPYPDAAPRSSVPASLLKAFPRLPEGLEYRFVGPDLILLDTRANLIVDIIHDALPR